MVQVRDNLGLGTVSSVGELPSDGSEYLARGLQDATSTASRVARLMQDENIRKRNAQFNNKRLDNDRALNTASVEGIRVAAEAPDFAVQDFETVEAAFLKNFEERHRALKQAMGLQGSLEEEQIDADYDVKKQFALGVLKQQHDAAVFGHRDGVLNQAFEDSLEGLRQAPENLVAALETQSAKLEPFRHDMTEEEFRTRSRSETAAHLATAVGSYIERGDYGAARQLLAGTDPKTGSHIPVGLYLDEGDVQSLGETVRQLEQEDERDRRQDAETQRVLENSLSAEDAKRQIRETVAAEDREEVERRVAEQQELLEASERRESQRFANEMWERSWAGAIPPLVWRGMPAELQQAIRKDQARVRRMLAEDPSYDHSARASFPETLREIRNYDAEAFKTLDLTPYRGALSEADYSGFVQEQRDLRQGKVNPDARQDLFDEVVGLYRNQFRHMVHEADNFERQMEAFRAQEAREGRPINRADLLKRARELQPGLTGELGFREEDFLSEAERSRRRSEQEAKVLFEARKKAQLYSPVYNNDRIHGSLAPELRPVSEVHRKLVDEHAVVFRSLLDESEKQGRNITPEFTQALADSLYEEVDYRDADGESRRGYLFKIIGGPELESAEIGELLEQSADTAVASLLVPELKDKSVYLNVALSRLDQRNQAFSVSNIRQQLIDEAYYARLWGTAPERVDRIARAIGSFRETDGTPVAVLQNPLNLSNPEVIRVSRLIDQAEGGKDRELSADEIGSLIKKNGLPEKWANEVSDQGVSDRLGAALDRGYAKSEINRVAFDIIASGDSSQRRDSIEEFSKLAGTTDQGTDFTGNILVPLFEEFGSVFQSETNSLTAGMVAGGSAAAIALLLGQAGPQALFPEELFTVPGFAVSAFTAAYKTSNAFENFKSVSGETYLDLERMIQNGESHLSREEAVNLSFGVGAVATIVGVVSLPGINSAIAKKSGAVLRSGLKKALKNPDLQKAFAQMGADYAASVTEQGAQALINEMTALVGREFAAAVNEGGFNEARAEEMWLNVARKFATSTVTKIPETAVKQMVSGVPLRR
ncbi:hypothetical protein [Kiloniella sp. b19]|uniref:hypothetical protein n=1 Tax=Kiloniella sp. GXU_MW_B19 TaxID=3141326 RepID=UPI0031E282A7